MELGSWGLMVKLRGFSTSIKSTWKGPTPWCGGIWMPMIAGSNSKVVGGVVSRWQVFNGVWMRRLVSR